MSILIVAPYQELYKEALQVAEKENSEIIVIQGDLDNGLQRSVDAIKNYRIDIVISRGGTASLLRKNLDQIVIEISVTGYDLLRTIYPHFITKKKIAIVGFQNIIYGVQSIESILGAEFGVFTIIPSLSVEELVDEAIEWGADIIIGDAVSTEIGKHKGIDVELITSGQEAIMGAISEAKQLHEQMMDKLSTMERMNSIIEHSENGILYIDSKMTIRQANTAASKYLQKNKEQLRGKNLSDLFSPAILKGSLIGRDDNKGNVIKLGTRNFYVETIGIKVNQSDKGMVVFIQDIGQIQRLEAQIRKELSTKGLQAHYSFEQMITCNSSNKRTIEKAKQYSLTDSTILLLGETGTGKEFFAQSIHNFSLRKSGPFVAVNCAALPDTLLESELFGYAEGAFTGANKGGKPGLFELAHLGTIFLDEINEMSVQLQARFLRVLQEKEIMRVGDNKVVSVDVRVIAASNRNLRKEVDEGHFRSDLYYRIRVLDIEILPLRHKCSDILPLFRHFVEHYLEEYGYPMPEIYELLIETIENYEWPGNIRELRNIAEKFAILSSMKTSPSEVLTDLFPVHNGQIQDVPNSKKGNLRQFEIDHINMVLKNSNNNISEASRILGINRSTLRRKLNAQNE